ncbi:uncharacterized protein LOC135608776 [Musa acuminata AAA Group]|uniref:uncharacterized protein LOC135608776 n=1 Tax=Musa acuminata AAA Group TaxID=214697 RepID=UPI0031E0371D
MRDRWVHLDGRFREQLGELPNVAQLAGLNAVQLIGLIVQAANTARLHRKNCRHFARHLKLISEPPEQLKVSSGLRMRHGGPTFWLDSCQNRSYLYLLAMAQNEIDRYLKIMFLGGEEKLIRLFPLLQGCSFGILVPNQDLLDGAAPGLKPWHASGSNCEQWIRILKSHSCTYEQSQGPVDHQGLGLRAKNIRRVTPASNPCRREVEYNVKIQMFPLLLLFGWKTFVLNATAYAIISVNRGLHMSFECC